MDFSQVKELIKILDASSLTELDIKIAGDSVRLSKACPGQIEMPVNISHKPVPPTEFIMSPNEGAAGASPSDGGTFVLSPLVGTFYESPAPNKPAFVKTGDKVKAGDLLCIIEAMKVMNEITAKNDGIIAEILVKNEAMVEYNQKLFRIV